MVGLGGGGQWGGGHLRKKKEKKNNQPNNSPLLLSKTPPPHTPQGTNEFVAQWAGALTSSIGGSEFKSIIILSSNSLCLKVHYTWWGPLGRNKLVVSLVSLVMADSTHKWRDITIRRNKLQEVDSKFISIKITDPMASTQWARWSFLMSVGLMILTEHYHPDGLNWTASARWSLLISVCPMART